MTAAEFLALSHDFQLGGLDTERPHPLTTQLSRLAQDDPLAGVQALQAVDVAALEAFCGKAEALPALARAIAETLAAGGRLFFCGCGATGRLSLSLEFFCRDGLLPPEMADRVIGFMAGGDVALIRAVEKFEDHPEYGARQLEELGFAEGDLLIATTEGGETPWVIGATERAAALSQRAPFFLYCNPDDVLVQCAERSRRVLENPQIRKINLAVGPMALSGSTRMQASTVLMAAVGFAIQHRAAPDDAVKAVRDLLALVQGLDYGWLGDYIIEEARIAAAGQYVLYEPGPFGITVLTDTTERSPTFSMLPFESQRDPRQPASSCHLFMPAAEHSRAAWQRLLLRAPRPLTWPETSKSTGLADILAYDFSGALPRLRAQRTKKAMHHVFRIEGHAGKITFHFGRLHQSLKFEASGLVTHLVLKMILNTHSTLMAGRMGRYVDNVMTWVKPANNKLIDRAIRYATQLVAQRTGTAPSYAEACEALFLTMKETQPGQPVVLRTMERLMPAATASV